MLLGVAAATLWTTQASAADAPGSASLEAAGNSDDRGAERAHRRWTHPFAVDVSAATWVPLSVGPEVTAELPGRVLLSAHVGWMPELFGRSVTDVLRRSSASDGVGPLIDGAMQDATLWRLAAGWRPLASAGLELSAGYAHVGVDGTSSAGEIAPLLPAPIGERLSEEIGASNVKLSSSIHHLTVAAGWRWLIADHLVIRANLGYLHAIASSSALDVEDRPDLSRVAAPVVERALNERYMRYVRLPVVGLGVGYRF